MMKSVLRDLEKKNEFSDNLMQVHLNGNVRFLIFIHS